MSLTAPRSPYNHGIVPGLYCNSCGHHKAAKRYPWMDIFCSSQRIPAPLLLAVANPDVGVIPSKGGLPGSGRHHIGETEELLIHQSLRPVDNACGDGGKIAGGTGISKGQLYQQIPVQSGNTGHACIFGILQDIAISKQLP